MLSFQSQIVPVTAASNTCTAAVVLLQDPFTTSLISLAAIALHQILVIRNVLQPLVAAVNCSTSQGWPQALWTQTFKFMNSQNVCATGSAHANPALQ